MDGIWVCSVHGKINEKAHGVQNGRHFCCIEYKERVCGSYLQYVSVFKEEKCGHCNHVKLINRTEDEITAEIERIINGKLASLMEPEPPEERWAAIGKNREEAGMSGI